MPSWVASSLSPPRAEYAFNGDVAIAYGVVGDGPVDLVYIQGFVSDVELMWDCRQAASFFERIAGWARLITIDRRGTGMSDRFSADRPPAARRRGRRRAGRDGCRRVASRLDLRPSRGRASSARCSRPRIPSGCERSVCSRRLRRGRPPPGTIRTQPAIGTVDEVVEQLAPFLRNPDRSSRNCSTQRRRRMAGTASSIASCLGSMRHAASPDSAVGFLRLLFETDITGILGSIEVPTQVLHRVDDRSLPITMRTRARRGDPRRSIRRALRRATGGRSSATPTSCSPRVEGVRARHGASASRPARRTRSARSPPCCSPTSSDSTARSADARRPRLERAARASRRRSCARRSRGSGGREVKTMGDGFLATFDGPARAVECAAGDRSRRSSARDRDPAGVHTGEVDVRGRRHRGHRGRDRRPRSPRWPGRPRSSSPAP